MFRFVTPHLRLERVLDLQVAHLRALGLRGLLLDVDCTLKDHRVPSFPQATIEWVRKLRASDVRLCLLSNGRSRRIGGLAESLGVEFVAKAFKPLPFGCHKALRKLDLPAAQVGVVGDQVFADVLAGRLAGLFTILVRPTSPEEPWFTRVKRPLERRVLRWVGSRIPPLPELPPDDEGFPRRPLVHLLEGTGTPSPPPT